MTGFVTPSPRRLLLILSGVSGAFLLAHILTLISWFGFGHNHVRGLVPFFNMEYELNAPATWSTLLLLTAAVLLAIVAREMIRRHERFALHWSVLSGIFGLLAVDEFASFHERSIDPLVETFNLSGVLTYAWIVPGALVVLIIGVCYLRFLFALPRITRNLFIVAACMYVGSALGFELFEGALDDAGQWRSLPYMIFGTIEETMEMAGICLFSYAIARHLQWLRSDASPRDVIQGAKP